MTSGVNEDRALSRLADHGPALEAFLAEASGAGSARLVAAGALTGGAIQENWLLTVDFPEGREELVLRTDAATGLSVSWSRAEEFALLRAARAAGVTVPEPLWLCEGEAVLGKPFYVMRRLPGQAAGHRVVKAAEGWSDAEREALAERLGEELARIHSIRPPREDLAFLDAPPESPALAAVAEKRRHLDALEGAWPALEWGLRWCELRAPRSTDVVLVHQDFRSGNYMIEGAELTGILDWEFCTWGDPMADIGWFCARCWRFGHPEREAGGIAGREPFYRGYERVSGRRIDPAAVSYWEVMAHLRWAVIALQQGERFHSGGEASLELALTGRLLPAELGLEVLARTPPSRWAPAP